MSILIVVVAWQLRQSWIKDTVDISSNRYQQTILLFIIPPLLLLNSTIAVVCMGPHGQMVWLAEGWWSYGISLAFVVAAIGALLRLAWLSRRIVNHCRKYPRRDLGGIFARTIDISAIYCAQIGFWQPELIVSSGFLNEVNSVHQSAILAHEIAHLYYRDNFCFFWLGWLRNISFWLPHSESMWQELLFLREIRADRWAAKHTDSLILAEALLLVVKSATICSPNFSMTINDHSISHRLERRIDALFDNDDNTQSYNPLIWTVSMVVFLPLSIVPFHA
jgi:Zn-dependent protease with chaperone function